MTDHGAIVIVSIQLSPSKALIRSDLETLLAVDDAAIFFGDFNCKHTDWRCTASNANAIGAFTNYVRTVVESSLRTVPATIDRRKLLTHAFELLRAKNVALRRTRISHSRK
ncbi:hypothetical protein EVAR_75113_1 [Eumeta japonica]|uniref:Endonuclease/exonuclease/phosphatase domain-containing protein n=1 Tax=Eumeta variegata TaxID=151549 RepID=A0A4C1U0E3_EUMVA|nr:hypothetical protein EVAR_75113_1 [Eumeta japonica]